MKSAKRETLTIDLGKDFRQFLENQATKADEKLSHFVKKALKKYTKYKDTPK